jgi:hypothetical protein
MNFSSCPNTIKVSKYINQTNSYCSIFLNQTINVVKKVEIQKVNDKLFIICIIGFIVISLILIILGLYFNRMIERKRNMII